jgi:hypothetical protein
MNKLKLFVKQFINAVKYAHSTSYWMMIQEAYGRNQAISEVERAIYAVASDAYECDVCDALYQDGEEHRYQTALYVEGYNKLESVMAYLVHERNYYDAHWDPYLHIRKFKNPDDFDEIPIVYHW